MSPINALLFMSNKPGITIKALIFWLVIGLVIGWSLNAVFDNSSTNNETNIANPENVDMDLFWDVWELIQEDYIDIGEIAEEDQVYGAISGLVDSLEDPYSIFMDPEETEEFHVSLDGELEGIGAELTVRDGKLVIVSPLKDTPAEEAGILPGDHIYLVDGEPTSEMTIWDAIMKIRGEPNTEVVLTIIRDGIDDPFEVPIIRQTIHVPSVELSFEETEDGDNIAHLALYQFADDTYSEFSAAVREILLQEVDGMILDMRLNGGGYLDVSVEVLSEFFEDEVKAVVVKRRSGDNDIIYTEGKGQLTEVPIVVLIDEGSASASEIVAGAMQDYDRAIVMGEQSFGKGSVQELSNLSGGSSMRLTIAKWYTPDDRSIDDVGITPDTEIEMETTAMDTEDDIQFQAAFDYLDNL